MMQNLALEFDEPIFSAQSKKIAAIFSLPNNRFWVATNDDKVIGTIAMTKLQDGNAVVKSMLVDQAFRGQAVADLLLAALAAEAIQNQCTRLYPGTMARFAAGQRFYEKNGFVKCESDELCLIPL